MFIIYCVGKLDLFIAVMGILGGGGLTAAVIAAVALVINSSEVAKYTWALEQDPNDEYDKRHLEEAKTNCTLSRKVLRISILFSICGVVALFTPSSRTLAAMYLIPQITANEQVQQLPTKAMKVLDGKLDEWLEGFDKE